MQHLRLGINIDHIATLRNVRGGLHPDPLRALAIIADAGGDGVTAHLREDRRHIKDEDVQRIISAAILPLNLEMAATDEMLSIALKTKPNACCIVPEKRAELTTEGGLDVYTNKNALISYVDKLKNAGIRVSLFVDASEKQINAASEVGADIIEIHTGSYCHAAAPMRQKHLNEIITAAKLAEKLGLECHAGHGLCFATVADIAKIPTIMELNIGHFLIGEAVFTGLHASINKMRLTMNEARG